MDGLVMLSTKEFAWLCGRARYKLQLCRTAPAICGPIGNKIRASRDMAVARNLMSLCETLSMRGWTSLFCGGSVIPKEDKQRYEDRLGSPEWPSPGSQSERYLSKAKV